MVRDRTNTWAGGANWLPFFTQALRGKSRLFAKRVPTDPRRFLGKPIESVRLARLRRGPGNSLTWEDGGFEIRTLLTLQFNPDADGIVTSAILVDSSFQPTSVDDLLIDAPLFLKKHGLWRRRVRAHLAANGTCLRLTGLANVSTQVPIFIYIESGGIAIRFGAR